MLTKTSKQVINALVELAKLPEGECAGTAGVALKIDAPHNYLGKVLQGLCSKGIVISQKGLGGGFRLARDPKNISLYDVVEPLENVTAWSVCALRNDKCNEKDPCPLHHQWKGVKDHYLNFLKQTTIADLMK